MVYIGLPSKNDMQNLPKFPTSPSPYHRRLLTSLLQSFAAHRLQRRQRAAAPGRRQKPSCAPLRVGALAALPGGARRGETMVKPHFSPEKFYEKWENIWETP